jgi:hypothetical protein
MADVFVMLDSCTIYYVDRSPIYCDTRQCCVHFIEQFAVNFCSSECRVLLRMTTTSG